MMKKFLKNALAVAAFVGTSMLVPTILQAQTGAGAGTGGAGTGGAGSGGAGAGGQGGIGSPARGPTNSGVQGPGNAGVGSTGPGSARPGVQRGINSQPGGNINVPGSTPGTTPPNQGAIPAQPNPGTATPATPAQPLNPKAQQNTQDTPPRNPNPSGTGVFQPGTTLPGTNPGTPAIGNPTTGQPNQVPGAGTSGNVNIPQGSIIPGTSNTQPNSTNQGTTPGSNTTGPGSNTPSTGTGTPSTTSPNNTAISGDSLLRGLANVNVSNVSFQASDLVNISNSLNNIQLQATLQALNNNTQAMNTANSLTQRLRQQGLLQGNQRVVGFQDGRVYIMSDSGSSNNLNR